MNEIRKSFRKSDEQAWLATISLMILASVALAFVLSYTREVTLSFVLAVFIASVVSPVVDFQVIRWKVPHPIAVLFAVVLSIIMVALFVFLLIWSATKLVEVSVKYTEATNKMITPTIEKWTERWNAFNRKEKEIEMESEIGPSPREFSWTEQLAGTLPNLASSVLNKSLSVLSFTFFVLIFVMFILAGRDPYVIKEGIYAEIDQKIRSYIATKLAVSFVTGVLVWVSLYWLGLELAGVFGLLAFLLNFIPSVGSIISTLLPIPLAIIQFQNPWLIAGVIFIPGTIQMAVGNFIEPKLMGEGLQLHAIVILMALAFWGFIWGPVGTLLAVPMTAVLRIVLLRFETVRPLGELLGGKLPQSSEGTSVV
ncbi:Uncharacterized UPF0118 membrane protein [hydrothermal vent metagenome]|uniref:Uncharacterized UPF0118 membrane protein n=1 Tax=hydrothermal vent metagenome TaxID=652676 RepID=A0A3B1D0T6_9ZZZZ